MAPPAFLDNSKVSSLVNPFSLKIKMNLHAISIYTLGMLMLKETATTDYIWLLQGRIITVRLK